MKIQLFINPTQHLTDVKRQNRKTFATGAKKKLSTLVRISKLADNYMLAGVKIGFAV